MAGAQGTESWDSRIGVILAVAGSAVGLGNFLRFPGLVAEYGGGAFMLAYFISLLIIGLPTCWAEWTMGRRGGRYGFNSSPAILAAVTRRKWGKWVGVIGVVVPVTIYTYYVYIEAWCLGYATNFALGNLDFETADAAGEWFGAFVGIEQNGAAVGFGIEQVGVFLLLSFLLNFFLIYRGISKGIEFFCKYALPLLIVLAVIILVRVLTLSPPADHPEQSIANGLGYMWNPDKVVLQTGVLTETEDGERKVQAWSDVEEIVGADFIEAKRAEVGALNTAAKASAQPERFRLYTRSFLEQMANPSLWIAAASQIFFSLSIGFGVIITYSSYMDRKDDVVLSGLAASSANEFCEVGLGGLITIPAAFVFLGAAGIAGYITSSFALGFNVLPMVFSQMPAGEFFGALFFFLLFLAAVTSSLSMLQPGIAFVEEAYGIGRKQSVALLGVITALGCGFMVWASEGLKGLDTVDFWVTNLLMVSLATLQMVIFGWTLGVERGLEEAHQGATIRIPGIFAFFMKWVTPLFLVTILMLWLLRDVLFSVLKAFLPASMQWWTQAPKAYITDLVGGVKANGQIIETNPIAWYGVGIIALVILFVVVSVARSRFFKNVHNPVGERGGDA
ncbi:MAG: sodium-dependent transporter [Opitutales bacterium]